MRIEDLCEVINAEGFPKLGVNAHPERESVLTARLQVQTAVADDEFLADCIGWELDRLGEHRLGRGLVPFFIMPDTGVRFAFGYWPPGGTPGPHEHTAWTITGVCRNELEVLTFDRAESYRRRELVPKNRFEATAGRVGYIYEPCIHQPRNNSTNWSLSLHVSSPRDGEPVGDEDGCLPQVSMRARSSSGASHPYLRVQAERQRQAFIRQLVNTLKTMDVPKRSNLIAQCLDLASSPTWRRIQEDLGEPVVRGTLRLTSRLSLTDAGLHLTCRHDGDMAALDVQTPNGVFEELAVDDVARDAIEFIAKEPGFRVRDLPGMLTDDERFEIVEALEDTALFTRVEQ